MIELRDTVIIDAPPASVWAWLKAMPEHYADWHPDHISARWVRGVSLSPGTIMEVEELLHGRPHSLRMKLTGIEPGRRIRYRIFPGLQGSFALEPVDAGTRFTAIIEIGMHIPILEKLLDRVILRIISERLEALRKHQAEEGANLKILLEKAES